MKPIWTATEAVIKLAVGTASRTIPRNVDGESAMLPCNSQAVVEAVLAVDLTRASKLTRNVKARYQLS